MLTGMRGAGQEGPTVAPLDARDDAAAVDVLVDAFSTYPSTAWIVEPCHQERTTALATLFAFFVAARRLRQEHVVGAWLGGELVAVALASDPDGPASPPELAVQREALWAELGSAARARYEAYGAASAAALSDVSGARAHLNLLGVRRDRQGHGAGGVLVTWLLRAAATRGAGLSTTTEDPANLAFYERHGLRRAGASRLAERIDVWGLLAPPAP